jgi:adenylosuccinate synthase
MIIACLGLQFGDEGKSKIADYLATQADYVVKFQGGPNSGGQVFLEDKMVTLHQIPAGIIQGKKCVLANGMVLEPDILVKEVVELQKLYPDVAERLYISSRSHVIQQEHRDKDNEGSGLGTTKKGIGYCYADKHARTGIRIQDLKNFPLQHRVFDTVNLLHNAYQGCKNILFQGAQGFQLDIDHGTYPHVTSSSCSIGGISTGTGFPANKIDTIVGIAKAYTTRIGTGPFPTQNKESEQLQTKGNEFGATTGRPRKCGWLDLVALRHAAKVNGIDFLALTKLDILTGLRKIPICHSYTYKNSTLYELPPETSILEKVTPSLRFMPGWQEELSSDKPLPPEAVHFVKFIENAISVPVGLVSIGPHRNDIIANVNLWNR